MPDIDVRLANKLDSAGAFTGAAWFGACVVGADSPSIADSRPTAGPLRFPRLCAILLLAQRSLRPQRWPTVRFHAPNDTLTDDEERAKGEQHETIA